MAEKKDPIRSLIDTGRRAGKLSLSDIDGEGAPNRRFLPCLFCLLSCCSLISPVPGGRWRCSRWCWACWRCCAAPRRRRPAIH